MCLVLRGVWDVAMKCVLSVAWCVGCCYEVCALCCVVCGMLL